MAITIKVDGMAGMKADIQALGPKARSALAFALNGTANDAQTKVKASLRGKFTLRRDTFVQNTIYRQPSVDFATKHELRAALRVNPARDFLAQHEEGGQKTARSGGMVAIPTKTLKPSTMTVVPKRLRPSGLRSDMRVRKITENGKTWLVRTKESGRGKGRKTSTEFLYQLKRSVPLRPRLSFIETATREIDRSWKRQAVLAINFAFETWR